MTVIKGLDKASDEDKWFLLRIALGILSPAIRRIWQPAFVLNTYLMALSVFSRLCFN